MGNKSTKILPSLSTVSIIIPSHNRMENLTACIDSLLEIDYPKEKLETIVVDAGPSYKTAQKIKSFRGVKVLRSSQKLGFAKSIEWGISSSRGAVLVFLGDDMRVDAGWLSALVESLSPVNNVVCSCSHILGSDGSRLRLAGRDIDAFGLEFGDLSVPPTSFTTHSGPSLFASTESMAILRRAYMKASGFDSDYVMYHEDVDLGWRLWIRGYKVVFSKDSIANHQTVSARTSLDFSLPEELRVLQIRNLLYTLVKNFGEDNLRFLLQPILSFISLRMQGRFEFRAVAKATIEVGANLKVLLMKRSKIQRRRIKSDSEIFEEAGHPFQFLLSSNYLSCFQTDTKLRETSLEQNIRESLLNALSLETHVTEKEKVIQFLRDERAGLYQDKVRLQEELHTLKSSFGYRFMQFYGSKIDRLFPDSTNRGKFKLAVKQHLKEGERSRPFNESRSN